MKIIDISVLVNEDITVWPGNKSPQLRRLSDMKKRDAYNETSLAMNVHSGTHLDAPLHFISKGQAINQMNLSIFIGRVFVADIRNAKEITANDLEKINLPKNIKRLLFKTSNSVLWNKKRPTFIKNYIGITPDAARWIVKRKLVLVGIDYLSIAKFSDTGTVHRALLKAGIAILEGINLTNVKEGEYQLIGFPIKIANAEGAPVRAVLIR